MRDQQVRDRYDVRGQKSRRRMSQLVVVSIVGANREFCGISMPRFRAAFKIKQVSSQLLVDFYPSSSLFACFAIASLLMPSYLKNHNRVLRDLDIALCSYQDFATLSLPVTPPSDMALFEATSKHSVDQDISSYIRT
jgi:hypothetical protein